VHALRPARPRGSADVTTPPRPRRARRPPDRIDADLARGAGGRPPGAAADRVEAGPPGHRATGCVGDATPGGVNACSAKASVAILRPVASGWGRGRSAGRRDRRRWISRRRRRPRPGAGARSRMPRSAPPWPAARGQSAVARVLAWPPTAATRRCSGDSSISRNWTSASFSGRRRRQRDLPALDHPCGPIPSWSRAGPGRGPRLRNAGARAHALSPSAVGRARGVGGEL